MNNTNERATRESADEPVERMIERIKALEQANILLTASLTKQDARVRELEAANGKLRRAALAALRAMGDGRPSDPRDGEKWDKAAIGLAKALTDSAKIPAESPDLREEGRGN